MNPEPFLVVLVVHAVDCKNKKAFPVCVRQVCRKKFPTHLFCDHWKFSFRNYNLSGIFAGLQSPGPFLSQDVQRRCFCFRIHLDYPRPYMAILVFCKNRSESLDSTTAILILPFVKFGRSAKKNIKPHPSVREMGSSIRLSLVLPVFRSNRPCPPVSFGCRW